MLARSAGRSSTLLLRPLLLVLPLVLLTPIRHAAPVPSPDSPASAEEAEGTAETPADEPTPTPSHLTTTHFDEAVKYLFRFGYIAANDTPALKELREGLILFQEMMGIEASGEVDEATLKAMRSPRCSAADLTPIVAARRRRYVLAEASKWPSDKFTGERQLRLKWYVSHYTRDMPKSTIRNIIQKAFALWSINSSIPSLSPVTLRFEEASRADDADIEILWAEGEHGDGNKFDGPGITENALAHTFFPGYVHKKDTGTGEKPKYAGDIHFDDAEKWESEPGTGGAFFPYVLAHEIGHALGLQHSRRPRALMHPLYRATPLETLALDIDDKCAINWNYAGPSNFCLFVWLMSEIIPIHNNSNSPGGTSGEISWQRRMELWKSSHSRTRIPRCRPNNHVKKIAEDKLRDSLHFPRDVAASYVPVVCNFLDGLHEWKGGSDMHWWNPDEVENTLDVEFYSKRLPAAPAAGNAPVSAYRRLLRRAAHHHQPGEPSMFERTHFNTHFFRRFFKLYFSA